MIGFLNKFKVAAALLCGIALVLTLGCAISPPVQEMSDARQAIAAAKEAGAEQHAEAALSHAELMLNIAEKYLQSGVYWPGRAALQPALPSSRATCPLTGTP